jgi:hypothetical protein
MIISVSRRTDIIGLYTDWFIDKIKKGYCNVSNPYNRNQVSKVSLTPKDVDFFVFWTRYPKPILKYLDFLDKKGYKYYFMITLNNYPKEFEKYSPIKEKVIDSIKSLSDKISRDKVIWRYDPIIITDLTNESWHLKNFYEILSSIGNSISKIKISFVDIYRKNKKFIEFLEREHNLKLFPSKDFFKNLSLIAREYKIKIETCSENVDLEGYNISKGVCIDPKILNIEKNYAKDKNQRKECLCRESKDIGAYDTCIFGCRYCYASNFVKALKNYKNIQKFNQRTFLLR